MIKTSAFDSNHFQLPDFSKIITDDMIYRIKNIRNLAETQYCNLNIPDTLTFYTKRYVKQLHDFTLPGKNTIIVDVGTGFGWLPIAFSYVFEGRIVALDQSESRVNAGKQIADILEVGDRIDWCVGTLGNLPLEDKKADIVYCIEVLEHVKKSAKSIHDLCRISRKIIILTTHNQWFPIISHDTRLPFCHWLPIPIRRLYAKVCKVDREYDNLFWSPYSLLKNVLEFKPISKWFHYSSYKRYKETFPFYLPYGNGVYVNRVGVAKGLYYAIVSKFGMFSHYLTPTLAYVLKRQKSE